MSQQDQILVSVNKALARKLRREASASAKASNNSKTLDSEGVRKRRHIENSKLAKELGITLEELSDES